MMPPNVLQDTRKFYNLLYKNNTDCVTKNEIFEQMKPRLQNEILDTINRSHYNTLEFVFKDTELAFKRIVIAACRFKAYIGTETDGALHIDAKQINDQGGMDFTDPIQLETAGVCSR